jgi:hypothetical protein
MNLSTGCIEFSGSIRRDGYGVAQFQGKQYLAHRLAFSLNEYKHPMALTGLVVRHKCDNPSCINVEHLEPGTQADNMTDMAARNRRAVGSKVGTSKLSELQVKEIRAAYTPRSKTHNQYQLARKYGVSQSEISHVISIKRWAHI